MATYKEASIQQSTGEIRIWTFDYTDDLLSGVTVASGTATHTPPSGDAGSVTVTASSPYLYLQVGPLSVTGQHYLDGLATLSNGEKSNITLAFTVNYPTLTARSGMLDIIRDLRAKTDAGPNDFTVAGVPYWSDKQLQTALDKNRQDFYRANAEPQIQYVGGGTTEYKIYYTGIENIEQTTGGTAIFWIEDADGDKLSSDDYTMDYERGVITFDTDHGGTAYYVTGRTYDLNTAAANIWQQKAANAGKYFDFSTDNHSLKKSQLMQHCLEMSNYYSSLAGPTTIQMYREDNTWA